MKRPHPSALIGGGIVLAALSLTGCNKSSELESAALEAESSHEKSELVPVASDTPRATPPTLAVPAAVAPKPPAAAAPTMSSMTPLPVATESIPIPEPAKVPPIDLQRIDGIETQIHVQREDLDNLKAGQIELSSLIESLRVELQRVTQPQAKLKPTSDRGAPSRRLEAIRSPAPPFLVESVDTWGSEKRIVVKTPQGRRELKSGDSYAGWTAQGGSDANHAAFRDPEGHAIRLGVTWK